MEDLFSSIGEPPEARKTEFEEIEKLAKEQNSNFETVKSQSYANGFSFDKLLHLITAETLSLSLKELKDCEASYKQCINACSTIHQKLTEGAASWDEHIKELFPKNFFTISIA